MPQMSNGQETLVGRDSVLMENRNTREDCLETLLQECFVGISRMENILADPPQQQKNNVSLHSESNGQEKLVGRASVMEKGNTREDSLETLLQEYLVGISRIQKRLADPPQQQKNNVSLHSESNGQEKLVGRASVMEKGNTREDSLETLLQEYLVGTSRIQKRLDNLQQQLKARTDSDSKAGFKRGVGMIWVLFFCFLIITLYLRIFTDYFSEQKIFEKPTCQGTSQGVS